MDRGEALTAGAYAFLALLMVVVEVGRSAIPGL